MFGLLNVVTRYCLRRHCLSTLSILTCHSSRPLGGIISDLLYKHVSTNLWLKKGWILLVGIISGAFLIAIGLLNPQDETTMFGLIAGMAFFLEAGNGYDSLLPLLRSLSASSEICLY